MKSIRHLLARKGNAVQTIGPDASVFEALESMARHDIGALVVVDDEAAVIGLLSERDYARKVILYGRISRDTRVRDIMTTGVLCVTSKQTVDACMALMTRHRIRHIPVVENGQLSGIVSIGDVVSAIIENQQFTIEQLEHYITGSR
ncbi:CBS domain-containing protein [Myxococcota bacterium]|nr:CBS domain-containing protein [Myxococcota bacterium]MCZ7620463.1 CBS domain-containing protein [Myxococcota bacterium]